MGRHKRDSIWLTKALAALFLAAAISLPSPAGAGVLEDAKAAIRIRDYSAAADLLGTAEIGRAHV